MHLCVCVCVCVCVFVFKTYEKIHTLLKMLVKLQLVTTINPVSPIYKKKNIRKDYKSEYF